MQKAAITSRFLTGYSSKVAFADSESLVSRRGLLQNIVASRLAQTAHSHETFVKLTNELIHCAEQAYIVRDVKVLDEVSQVLMNLPVDAARQIGSYYYSLAIYRRGRRDEADALLERIADVGPITYRAQALQALGAHSHGEGRLDEALRFQLEALRAASDTKANGLKTALMARWEISIIKSLDGDHKDALSDLKGLTPLVSLVSKQTPFYFYFYCNDLAVVLGELGYIGEALRTVDIALASPYAPLYPNWAETRLELEAKRASATPSVVAINRPSVVIPAPQTQPSQNPNFVVAFWWLGVKGTALQTTLIPVPGSSTRAGEARREILEVLGRSIRSRAPPVRTEYSANNSIIAGWAALSMTTFPAHPHQGVSRYLCVSNTRPRAPRTGMSITKKHDKSANTISGGGRFPRALVAQPKIHRNPRVRAAVEFMNSNLERRISLGSWQT